MNLKSIEKQFLLFLCKLILKRIGHSINREEILDEYEIRLPLPKSKLQYAQDLLYTFNNADFLKDNFFLEAYRKGKSTDLGMFKDVEFHWRAHVLCWFASNATKIRGDFVECGVNTGMYARTIIHYTDFVNLPKTFYLLDTFCGLDEKYSSPEEMRYDKNMGYKNQKNLYEHVCSIFKPFNNVKIIKGAVPETLTQVKSEEIAFLSIDMNCVHPEIAALEFFWDKIVKGGIIILDDYGYPGHENQKKAHDDFANKHNVKILSLPTCQGVIIKY
jgi:hypothetical protein